MKAIARAFSEISVTKTGQKKKKFSTSKLLSVVYGLLVGTNDDDLERL